MENGVNGLVLAGGKSTRLGQDKRLIRWHGKEQQYYLADLLKSFCKEVFISCRQEQSANLAPGYHTIADNYTGIGPYGGILSAFEKDREAAWLVVACDLLLLDEKTIDYLLQHRNRSGAATTFQSPYDGMPEPLITIWEPKAYDILITFLHKGVSCPRKVLMNTAGVTILTAPDADALVNVNTPDDFHKASEIFETKKVQINS